MQERILANMTKVRLCFHDRCFDGTASAALFYRFYRERFDQAAEFGFTGMTHRAAQSWEAGLFDGDENVIVDFKFSNSPKVTWWFDHRQGKVRLRYQGARRSDSLGRHHRWGAVSDGAVGRRTRRAGNAARAGD